MDIVCFDTQVLIWGVQETSSSTQTEMIERAKYLIGQLSQSKTRIIVPSVVVGEFLLGIPSEDHAKVLNLMRESFLTAPYDLQAAARFASLWRERAANNSIKILQDDLGATRQELRADCMIVATALAQKASCIYSHDKRLKAFAGDAIQVIEIPKQQTQFDLFKL